MSVNNVGEAETRLRKAVTLEAANAVPWIVAAKLYYVIADREKFREAAEKGFALDPQNKPSLLLLRLTVTRESAGLDSFRFRPDAAQLFWRASESVAVLLSFGLGAAPSDPGCAIMMGLKPHPEMIKGPEAYERFKGMLKAIVAVPR